MKKTFKQFINEQVPGYPANPVGIAGMSPRNILATRQKPTLASSQPPINMTGIVGQNPANIVGTAGTNEMGLKTTLSAIESRRMVTRRLANWRRSSTLRA